MRPESRNFRSWSRIVLPGRIFENFDAPIHVAALYGLTGLMKRYIVAGTDLNSLNELGYSLLYTACLGYGELFGIDILLDYPTIDVNIQDLALHATPLLNALRARAEASVVAKLLRGGANPRISDCYGYTCLHLAVFTNDFEIIRLLFSTGVEVGAKDIGGETPLHWACKMSNISFEIVAFLMEQRADVNAQDAANRTPLDGAFFTGNEEVARLLLVKGAAVNNNGNAFGYTALHTAVAYGYYNLVMLAIEHDADILAKNKLLQDALAMASMRGQVQIIKLLLDSMETESRKTDSLLHRDINGQTALHLATINIRKEAIKILLDLDELLLLSIQTNHAGNTPIHVAVAQGDSDIVKMFLDKGADPNLKNGDDMTSLDLAFHQWEHTSRFFLGPRCDFYLTVKALMSKAPVVMDREKQLERMMFSIEKDKIDLCLGLGTLVNDANVTAWNDHSISSYPDKLGELIHAKDKHGWTPLMLATQLQRHEIIDMLSDNDLQNQDSVENGTYSRKNTQDNVSRKEYLPLWNSADKASNITVAKDGLHLGCPDGKYFIVS